MSFLAPLFLAGIVLVAGPILFHLIRQAPRNRVVFSSTDLLEPSKPKMQKSRRIQNPWLLLIRCLIIALLVFAFARPFVPNAADSGAPDDVRRDVVIAIDQSLSMSRPGISQRVMEETAALIDGLRDTDQLTVFGFTDTLVPIVSNAQWLDLPADQRKPFALQQVNGWEATSRPGKLDLAVSEAVGEIESLREFSSAASFGEIFVVSDFAEGTSLNGLEQVDWPNAISLRRIQATPFSEGPNLGLRWLNWTENADGEALAQVAVSTSQPQTRVETRLTVRDALTGDPLAEPIPLVLHNEPEQLVSIPLDKRMQGAPLTFALQGDDPDFDNTLPVAPAYFPKLEIGLFSDEATTDAKASSYFIAKAVQGFESPLTSLDAETPFDAGAQAYIVDRPLAANESDTLRRELENGKTALLLASDISITDTIRGITGNSDWSLTEREPGHLLVGEVDFKHPLFAPFADPRFSNFASIRTWNAPELQYPSNQDISTLARFDDGTPLLAEVRIGEGMLYVWSSGWAPDDSQWVLSSKFIPFLHRFALYSSGGPTLPSNASLTGINIARYSETLGTSDIEAVGIYAAPGAESRWVAFRSDTEESRTRPLSADKWDSLGLPDSDPATRLAQIEQVRLNSEVESAALTEQRQSIWKWLLWIVVALLATESLVAISIHRNKGAAA